MCSQGYWPEESGTGIYWNDMSSNEDGFKVYKAVNSFNTNYSLLGQTGAGVEFLTDNNIDPANYYCYKVTAFNGDGESGQFEQAIVPKTPVNLTGNANVSDISLQWDDPGNSYAQYFYIYRSVNSTGNFNKIDEIYASTTTYTDNAVSSGNEYYYRIEAIWTNSSDHVCRSLPTNYIGPFTVTGGGGGEPCPGTPTVYYEGQTYNTVLIGGQCWLKENLNVGTRIDGNQGMSNNGNIEKYCYDDDPENCEIYGGLYQWDEMMDYTTLEGTQGICPDGWHLPSDDEWKVLEGTVDSQYGVGDPEWDNTGWRGIDVGFILKSDGTWSYNGNGINTYGFSILGGGYREVNGSYQNLGTQTLIWTSTEYGWARNIDCYQDKIMRTESNGNHGFYVRCLKD
ncbi:MAG: hypothetical protein H8E34_07010 [Bacteroidetes bacterium]|nr:hypothetical protein [Bacteroidota bacterium]MBL6944614.1 hypothetical protein [Bacteroidales bacterium]